MSLSAQKNNTKLADVTAADLLKRNYQIDSGANGIFIANIGSSEYEVDNTGGFNIIFKKRTRIHLLNRNAFDEATITIPLYAQALFKEKVLNINAHTYTLQDGKLVDTKLEKNAIFEEKVNKNVTLTKFTMPNLQEGCIVDISYTVSSPFERDLKTWYFQESMPVLYSEYSCSIPAIYDFIVLKQGYNKSLPPERSSANAVFNLNNSGGASRTQFYKLNTTVNTTKWVMENIPKTSSETFSSTLKNRIDKVEFQLSAIIYPNEPVRPVMNSWFTAAEQMLNREDFGLYLKNNSWLNEETKKITGNDQANLEAAKKIYSYVRDNFTCKDHSAIYADNNMKKVWQAKAGNVAEINLILVAMLRSAGFTANPVILSTRDHGKAFEMYPIMDRFNYVICNLLVEDRNYNLDASFSKMGFGQLHRNAYNGFGRVIDAVPNLVQMQPDSVTEKSVTRVVMFNNENGELVGEVTTYHGNNESFNARETIAQKPLEEHFKATLGRLAEEYHPSNYSIDSLTKYEEPLAVRCGIKMDKPEEDIIYFNPIVYGSLKENPFAAGERKYPVEMGAAVKDVYDLVMDLPKGYKVDELPKSTRVKFNEDEGMFEYLIQHDGKKILLHCALLINKAIFDPEDYESLREFFAFVVKKQGEQIVLKKMKEGI